jgi:ribosomal protein L34E
MATGIISNRRRLLLRLANEIESRFPDAETCTQEGGGIHETRPEFLRKYKRTALRDHPDGLRRALLMTPGARTRFQAIKTVIQQRRAAGGATQEEIEIDDLPAEAELDATWDATPETP